MNRYSEQLEHPLFNGFQHKFFPEDISYYMGEETKIHPWQQIDHVIPSLIIKWDELNIAIEKQFKVSKNGERELMLEAIAIFLQLLFWTNGEPVQLKLLEEKLTDFPLKPFNTHDRLTFIFSRPTSFHTFKQLQELIVEQLKKFAVRKA